MYPEYVRSVIKRVFLRVAMVKRSKSGRGDEAKLITKAPCFLAYYPGEQYFYCDRSEPAPAIPDVSLDCCATYQMK